MLCLGSFIALTVELYWNFPLKDLFKSLTIGSPKIGSFGVNIL